MPGFLAAAAPVLAALMVADDLLTGGAVQAEIGKRAAQAVLDGRGIPLNLDGEVNHETITQAINAAVMPEGVEFSNLFDNDAVKSDVRRIGLAYAAEAYGYEGGLSASQLRERITSEIVREVLDDISAGGGEYMDAALGLVAAQRLIDKPEPKKWNVPRVFTVKAEKNRERQARYRASHKRVWI